MMNAASWPKINYEFTFIAYICNISNPIKKKPHELKQSAKCMYCGIQKPADPWGMCIVAFKRKRIPGVRFLGKDSTPQKGETNLKF